MKWYAAILAPVITLGCAAGGVVRAQSPVSPDLSRMEAAVDAGALDGLRAELDRWLSAATAATPEDIGRARFLRARLLADADSSRDAYLAIAMDGRSSYGARAWLRLAQFELARGEPARAVEDLERLRADYPRSQVIAASWYWTGRAEESGGGFGAACAAFDRASAEARSAGDALTGERAAVASEVCAPGGLRFTLQIGAFSGAGAAEVLSKAARDAGFPVRLVRAGGLEKVRVGWFGSPDAARLLARKLRAAGFIVAIVAGES